MADADFQPPYLLHELFERTAKRSPDARAVEWREDVLTYAELDRCAEALAGWLSRHGVERGRIVGLMLDRGLEMVVAIIGALKTGAAYLPLLPTWPRTLRIENLLDAGCRHLVLQTPFRQDFESYTGTKLEFDDCRALARTSAPLAARPEIDPNDLAYIIYTSGSTGKPKGVTMHHGGTAMNIALNASMSVQEGCRCCFSNKYTFDVHVADVFKPLSVCATIVVTRDIFRIPPVEVVSTLPNKIAVAKVPEALKVIVFTGEGITESAVRPIPVTTRTINIFGATEFFDASAKEIDRSTFPARIQSIGVPLGDYVQMWVMDPETMELVPDNKPGELVIGGRQVAKGYMNRPEITASKFFHAPWRPGSRVYRTGDLVRRCTDGEFEYLGRAVRSVEVRGQRIHLSAVEDALSALKGVQCAAVIVKEGPPPRLVAYVSPCESKAVVLAAIAGMPQHLAPDSVVGLDEMPTTYVSPRSAKTVCVALLKLPDTIIGVEEWPQTSSGKIDRNALHEVGEDGVLPESLRVPAALKPKRLQRMFYDKVSSPDDSDSNEDEEAQRAVASEELTTGRQLARRTAAAIAADPARLGALARAARVAAYRLGLVFVDGQLAPSLPPMTLLPSPVPQSRIEQLMGLAPVFSRLMDRVSCDFAWLRQHLDSARHADPWLGRLVDIAEEVYGAGGARKDPKADTRLLLARQDYLPHSDGRYLQVEINTIAVAFAGFTEHMSKLHAEALRSHCPEIQPRQGQTLAGNAPGSDYAAALAAAHRIHISDWRIDAARQNGQAGPRVCFFCFPEDHLELDQRHIEAALSDLGVPSFFAFLGARVELRGGDPSRQGAGGALLIDGIETSVVYFHCTYSPDHFPTEAAWASRRTMELSRAIKAPSLLAHLAGAKKVQEVLSNPKELRRFLPEEDVPRCMAVFAQQLDPSLPENAGVVAEALAAPEHWVLKPQREGGGNNFYDEELVEKLRSGEGLAQYVLMSKIQSEPCPALLLKGADAPVLVDCRSELGIFSTHLARCQEELLSTAGGAMLRTKASSSREGGVCAGVGLLDTPFVAMAVAAETPDVGSAQAVDVAKHAPGDEAKACLLLVCGLPGCGKSSFCRALMERAAAFPVLLGEPEAEWHHLCYDEVEAECRLEAGGISDAFDAATWRAARSKVTARAKELVDRGGSKRQVLVIDDNMYYRSMRKGWLHFAAENLCAFRQIFLQAPLELCLERNARRPPASRVPDFSVRHMAEVFQWPSVDGKTWEARAFVSILLDSSGASTDEQLDAFLARFSTQRGVPVMAFWEVAPVTVEDSGGAVERQSAKHSFDLALRKVVARALAEAPPELAKQRQALAKAWGARKTALVSAQLLSSGGEEASDLDVAALCNEFEESFLRSCVADVQSLAAAGPQMQPLQQQPKKQKQKQPQPKKQKP